jgi:hypothetical protein|tara:strand:- start:227 stop:370 length:144 start_codon:yes stop_codon:yes gene_type:complete
MYTQAGVVVAATWTLVAGEEVAEPVNATLDVTGAAEYGDLLVFTVNI